VLAGAISIYTEFVGYHLVRCRLCPFAWVVNADGWIMFILATYKVLYSMRELATRGNLPVSMQRIKSPSRPAA
jgi:hypothetical protein